MSSNDPISSAPRRTLFRKYFSVLFLAVTIPIVAGGAIEGVLGIRDQRALLDARLRVEVAAAAERIQSFIGTISNQLGWAVHLAWTPENTESHRIDALRLLRQIPAIAEISLLDGEGIERLKVSRIGRDIVSGTTDRSGDPAFLGARATGGWYGPVTLNRGSEPHMTLAVAGNRLAVGVAIAQLNLKLIWDLISDIRIGDTGSAFVMDANGRLVAHRDIDLVLRGGDADFERHTLQLRTTMSENDGGSTQATDIDGRSVIAAMAPVESAGWTVIGVQPVAEAYAPIRAALMRTSLLVAIGGVFAAALAYLLARRMTDPITQLEQGVARIGAGEFDHRIRIDTGDELEKLSMSLNRMASELAVAQERAERIARLKRFLSPQVAEIVEDAADQELLEPRRTEVVIVFCDLRNFTEFSLRASPEEVMQLVGEYYDAIGRCVTRHNATLTHFAGDGVMILVNAPLRCDGNPVLHAVQMAVDMQVSMRSIAIDWQAHGYAVGFGIGISLGVATVGRVGYEDRHDYTAIGSVVNLASRLSAIARDNQILLDPSAAATVKGEVELSKLGPRDLKGYASPVQVFAVHTHVRDQH